ncbi:hypothetical protein D8B46_05490 [Candidatus Gracilibacteria bacterium]|nr:MAG: hypothetical protein D8B46_05490 [Candidatus Gracilibacteria bacterium]
MFEFIKFLQKRPKDSTIIIIRLIFGLLLISVLYYNFFLQGEESNQIEKTILFGAVPDTTPISDYIKYGIVGLGVFPLAFGIFGIFKMPLAKKKYIRIAQLIFAVLLWYSAGIVVNTESLDINEFLVFAGFLPFFAGLTGKLITSNGLKYGEKITKIRV